MKKVICLMAFCLLFFAQILNAQKNIKPCLGVTASAFPLNPQVQTSNYYGVRVALGQPYTQNVTVVGGIHASDNEPSALWTLTIPAGSLTAETQPLIIKRMLALKLLLIFKRRILVQQIIQQICLIICWQTLIPLPSKLFHPSLHQWTLEYFK